MYISNIAFVSKNYTDSKDICYVKAQEASFTKDGTNAYWYDAKSMKRYTSIEANESFGMDSLVIYAKCDIDKSGYADAADMIILRKSLFDGTNAENADLNGDTQINIIDLIIMKKHLIISD